MQETYLMYPNASNEKVLYDFQKESLKKAKPNYLFALDTGTGKTITSIHHYMKHSKGEPLLIVAPPQKIKEGGWGRDLQFVANYYGVDFKFETLSYGVLATKWERFKGYFVIFDEAHYIKNPTSKRGKAGMRLSRASTHFVLLTATPMSNGWEDSYNYMIMFNHFRNKTEMNREHAVYGEKFFGTRRIPVIDSWRNEHVLQKHYNGFTVSIAKEDALDLPPLVIKNVSFKQSKEYRTIFKTRVLDEKAYDNPSKLTHGLREYANQKDKLGYLVMLLESVSNNIVVFYQYNSELEAMKEAIQKIKPEKKVFEVNGKASTIPKKESWSELKHSITLVQYQAGSAGIELQYANIVVFYTPTYSFQDYSQALGRTYRNGQEKKVTVYQFVTKGTIEEAVYEALERKEDFNVKLYLETRL